MSTKGLSIVASRRLVDTICYRYRLPLFVLHDFDQLGFTILRTLRCNTRRYTFENDIDVIDLGLRLVDVEEWGLESESVVYRESITSVRDGLRKSGATDDEIKFLLHQRVELNAFSSRDLVKWIEGKLDDYGVEKVIPGDEVLAEGYRRQCQSAYLDQHFPELLERSREHISDVVLPSDLREQVSRKLLQNPRLAWNDAVAAIARLHRV